MRPTQQLPTSSATLRIIVVLAMLLGSMALALHTSSPVDAQVAPTIVDGEPAARGEIPHQVALEVNDNMVCGGSLIAPNAVLTAAHCVDFLDGDSANLKVRSGVVNLNRAGQLRSTEKLVVHPGWAGTKSVDDDIAIVFVTESFKLNANTQVIDALSADVGALSVGGTEAVVSGWGAKSNYEPNAVTRLNKRTVTTLSDRACNDFFEDFNDNLSIVNKRMLCVDGQGGGPCVGDSGGPLTATNSSGNPVLIGVINWGPVCGLDGMGGVLAEVDYYQGWIERKLEKNSPPTTTSGVKTFTKKSNIRIPRAGTEGYGETSKLIVDGIGSEIVDIDVVILGLSHARASDVGIGLIAPNTDTGIAMMYGMGGDTRVKRVKLRFDDKADRQISSAPLTPGRYRPASVGDDPIDLTGFEGLDPNGEWRLITFDRATGKTGKVRGWKLIIRHR